MIDREKFFHLNSRGIFQTGEEFQKYCVWTETLKFLIDICEDRHLINSGLPHGPIYDAALNYAKTDTETSTHFLVHLMTQCGCGWTHLLLFRDLTGMEINPEHSGRFNRQLIDVIAWYEDLMDRNI